MPSSRRQKSKANPAARRAPPARKPVAKQPARPPARKVPTKPNPKSGSAASVASSGKPKASAAPAIPVVRRSDGRTHVLSLSFVRDGDEFLARMETDAGQITELKNRALDQLLTLVASELEDLLE